MPKRLTKEQFIEKSKKIHGDKYDYSKVEYIKNDIEVCIICPKHGEFNQLPRSHMFGVGCPECRGERISQTFKNNSLKNKEERKLIFIEKAQKIHGNKYSYGKTDLNNRDEKGRVIITCPKHGDFPQVPSSHLQGHGCPKCKSIGTDEFIKRAKKIHGDKYNYSKVEYKGIFDEVTIICPIHGEFQQTPSNHLGGCGCKECMKDKFRLGKDEFIRRAKAVHGDKYDYSKVDYISDRIEVTITCPKHGDFQQKPLKHMRGQGCSRCNESHLETEISEVLKKLNIEYEQEKKFNWIKDKLELPLDFYLPNHNLVIECQGIQHFEVIKHFGGEKNFILRTTRDKLKKQLCEEHDIEVIYFTHEKVEGDYLGKVFTDVDEMIKYIESKKQ
jgi:hypothetical protein